jgi:hypothetical protein
MNIKIGDTVKTNEKYNNRVKKFDPVIKLVPIEKGKVMAINTKESGNIAKVKVNGVTRNIKIDFLELV